MSHNRKAAFQRLDEWETLDAQALNYHESQWAVPKRSTEAFEAVARKYLSNSRDVIDLGAGAGAATAWIANRHPRVQFTALDYSGSLVEAGRKIAETRGVNNLKFAQGNWFDMSGIGSFDGCISLQTLSWFSGFQEPLKALFDQIKPRWIGVSSLFYEGDITCRIEVEEHKRSRRSFYNIYSLPEVRRFCLQEGYRVAEADPFVIDIDLPKPTDIDLMGTYTRLIQDGREVPSRLQISGPLLMSWYFVVIVKI